MVVISKTVVVAFGKEHADAIEALNDWWRITKSKQWKSLYDIKKDFGSVD
jgi:mRNA-degrading endonuclease HigB of HigAB toxin-antitoxin module